MERIKAEKERQMQNQQATKKFVPSLKVGGLGLSSLVRGDGTKT